jgi:hypothetical protein
MSLVWGRGVQTLGWNGICEIQISEVDVEVDKNLCRIILVFI